MNVHRSLQAMPQKFHFRMQTKSCNLCRYFIYPGDSYFFLSVPLRSLVLQHLASSGVIESSLIMLFTCECLLWVTIQKCLVNILENVSYRYTFFNKAHWVLHASNTIMLCWYKNITCRSIKLSFYTVSRHCILVPQGLSVLSWDSILFYWRCSHTVIS